MSHKIYATAKITLNLPPEQAEQIENLSWERRVRQSVLLREAVSEYLEKQSVASPQKLEALSSVR